MQAAGVHMDVRVDVCICDCVRLIRIQTRTQPLSLLKENKIKRAPPKYNPSFSHEFSRLAVHQDYSINIWRMATQRDCQQSLNTEWVLCKHKGGDGGEGAQREQKEKEK